MNAFNLVAGGICIGVGISVLANKEFKIGVFNILVGILNIILGFCL